HHLAGGVLVGIERIHSVEYAQQGRLAAARRTDEGRGLVLVQRQSDSLQSFVGAVEELQVTDRDLLLEIRGIRSGRVAGSGRGERFDLHDCFLWATSMRAPTLSASTARGMMEATGPASFLTTHSG